MLFLICLAFIRLYFCLSSWSERSLRLPKITLHINDNKRGLILKQFIVLCDMSVSKIKCNIFSRLQEPLHCKANRLQRSNLQLPTSVVR